MNGSILAYGFFQHALLAAVFSSVICGIIGSFIVARRLVFISGGITHASFGGIGIAYFMGWNPVLGAAAFGLLSALGVEYLTKRTGVREDSAIGIFWSAGMALGIIFIYFSAGYTPNLMSYLFGSILTVTALDLWLTGILGLIIVIFFLLFFNLILFVAFDEDYAKTKRIPVNWFNYWMISLVAITIVLNIRVVGVILVLSFLTIPQITANVFFHDLKRIIFFAILFALLGSVSGLFLSYYLDLPAGPVIIFIFVLVFLLAKGFYLLFRKIRLMKALNP